MKKEKKNKKKKKEKTRVDINKDVTATSGCLENRVNWLKKNRAKI